MKVLACVHNVDLAGGANRSFLMVLDGLRRDYGVQVDVLVPQREGALCDELRKRNVRTIYARYCCPMYHPTGDGLDSLRRIDSVRKVVQQRLYSYPLARRLRREKYELVYTNCRTNAAGLILAQAMHLPHVMHVREFFDGKSGRKNAGPWQPKMIAEGTRKIILISRALFSEYEPCARAEQLVYIPNGVTTPTGLPRHAHAGKGTGLHLLVASRFSQEKGQTDAVQALQILRSRGFDDIYLHLAGSAYGGEAYYLEQVREQAEALHLQDRVIFHDEVGDMQALRDTMDVALMTSWHETFGKSTVEAMRSGLAVIGTNSGGTAELIEDGVTGLLCEPQNPEDLANKIQRLYEDPALYERLSKNGYDYVQTHYLPEQCVRQVYETLQAAIRGQS